MQFNSYIFILLFLPCVVIGYFIFNRINNAFGKVFLILASMLFYGYGNWKFLFLLCADCLINYWISCYLIADRKAKKGVLAIGILINIGLLFYYKYTGFFIANINQVFHTRFISKELIMPLGISFFTFQQIAFLVNSYKGELPLSLYRVSGFPDYILYVLYFPKILMGPIVEPGVLIPQFSDKSRKQVNPENLIRGIKLFNYGLFKKLILCDTFNAAVAWGSANLDAATSMDLIIVMLCYAFVVYFDFSGYCDMAAGVSLMLNIDLPVNFDSPFKSLSIREFWGRWHITLGKFFIKYIYIPLGGSRKGKLRTYFNIMVVFS
ncbi:MAG: MBOAT family protein [Lachnospiraceae bacterium]|nr:MBOAT family protein [Lachnospiraceae bacterium]